MLDAGQDEEVSRKGAKTPITKEKDCETVEDLFLHVF
jgi:hypothetical protein